MKIHQHKDKKGNVYGKAHPVGASHKKQSTQEAHDRTVEMERKKDA